MSNLIDIITSPMIGITLGVFCLGLAAWIIFYKIGNITLGENLNRLIVTIIVIVAYYNFIIKIPIVLPFSTVESGVVKYLIMCGVPLLALVMLCVIGKKFAAKIDDEIWKTVHSSKWLVLAVVLVSVARASFTNSVVFPF